MTDPGYPSDVSEAEISKAAAERYEDCDSEWTAEELERADAMREDAEDRRREYW